MKLMKVNNLSDERPMFSLHTRQADTLLGGRVYGSMDATVLLLLA